MKIKIDSPTPKGFGERDKFFDILIKTREQTDSDIRVLLTTDEVK